MAFEVAPGPVRNRGSRGPVVAVVALVVGIVGLGAAAAGMAAPREPVSPGIASRQPGPVARAAASVSAADTRPTPSASLPADPLRLPDRIECHGLDATTCRQLALATIGVLPATGLRVSGIDAWASILCGDASDCPPARLEGTRPLGSTEVSFDAPGTRAWVNVVAPLPPPGREWALTQPEAWIVRWLP